MTYPVEKDRRKPGSIGSPVRLADGKYWMLSTPVCRPIEGNLTRPCVDDAIDRMFDATILGEYLEWGDLWGAARELLRANYELTEEEIAQLLCTSPGEQGCPLATEIIRALFGRDKDERTFTRWARSSLLANGLGNVEISAPDLFDVLSILVVTNRTVPFSKFSDACRVLDERTHLESLV